MRWGNKVRYRPRRPGRGLAILAGALGLAATGAGAGPLYFGGGNSQVAIHSAESAIGSQDPSGYVMSLGREFAGTWTLDLGTAFGHHLNTEASASLPADQARFDAAWLGLRKRFWWLPEYGAAPWLGGGAGYYRFQWQRSDHRLTGRGGFLAAGADVSLQGPWIVRAQVTRHWLPLHDAVDNGSFSAAILEYSASVIYRFGLH